MEVFFLCEVEGRATMVGGWRASSSVEQFHLRVRNWNLHSSMARLAPLCTLIMKPGCFLQNCTCLLSSVAASWSQMVGVPIAATELARDSALSPQTICHQQSITQ